MHSKAHIVHTSSPASHRWKEWVKQLCATRYIMDVWSTEEFQGLLYVGSSTPLIHWQFVLAPSLASISSAVWTFFRDMDRTLGPSSIFSIRQRRRPHISPMSEQAPLILQPTFRMYFRIFKIWISAPKFRRTSSLSGLTSRFLVNLFWESQHLFSLRLWASLCPDKRWLNNTPPWRCSANTRLFASPQRGFSKTMLTSSYLIRIVPHFQHIFTIKQGRPLFVLPKKWNRARRRQNYNFYHS